MYLKIEKFYWRVFLLICILNVYYSVQEDAEYCDNYGQKILVRLKDPPYTFSYRCLCPFSYYGLNCQWIRQILCMMSDEKVVRYNPDPNAQENPIDLQFMMECILRKLNPIIARRQRNATNPFYTFPITDSLVKQQQILYNMNMPSQFQIIWANTTQIFYPNGSVIKNESNINLTDQQIINSYPRVTYQKLQQFQGMPMFFSNVRFNLKVQKFASTDGLFVVSQPQLNLKQVQLKGQFGGKTKYLVRFSTDVKKQWQQYGLTRLQMTMYMNYNLERKNRDPAFKRRLCMKCARWMLVDPYYVPGQKIKIQNNKIPNSLYVIASFIGMFSLLWGGRTLLKIYKRWRSKKNLAFLQQADESAYEQFQDTPDQTKNTID